MQVSVRFESVSERIFFGNRFTSAKLNALLKLLVTLLRPDRGAVYYDERVCRCAYICLYAILSSELHVRSSPHFLPMAVARSSSGDLMIRYVFPVLRVTSFCNKLWLLDVAAMLRQ